MEQNVSQRERWIFWRELGFAYVLMSVCATSFFAVVFLHVIDLFTSEPIASSGFESRPLLNNILLWFHAVLAVPPLVIGPWLFLTQFREKHLRWHRYLGQVYVICCFLSAVTSLPLGLANETGVLPRVGFSSLAICWFSFTYIAYRAARQKKFAVHRVWMMRSYACTYAFVNVKMYFLIRLFLGVEHSYYALQVLQSCFSWTTNLLVVEVYLAASTYNGGFAGRKIFMRQLRKLPLKIGGFLAAFATYFLFSYYLFPMDQ